MSGIKWLPLESNPDVMNMFLEQLGVSSKWGISDVISLDEELLIMIPAPVLAMLLLFPVAPAHEEHARKQEEEVMAGGQATNEKVYFMKQTIKNACGTVALIHALGNNTEALSLAEGSLLKKFLTLTKNMNPEERGLALEENDDISVAHETTAQQGQTEAPSLNDDVNLHFISLVMVDNQLYELDGRKAVPISHGATTDETFVKDASRVCKEYMQRDPENLHFTVLSLGALSS